MQITFDAVFASPDGGPPRIARLARPITAEVVGKINYTPEGADLQLRRIVGVCIGGLTSEIFAKAQSATEAGRPVNLTMHRLVALGAKIAL